jgi:hypothetical protein
MKRFFAILALGFLTVVPSKAQDMPRQDQTQATKNDLRSYCILPEEVGMVQTPRDMPDCAVKPKPADPTCKKELWLKRPGGKCCVAIVREQVNGMVILNPKGFAYGPIPTLGDMTKAEADAVWGTDGQNSVDERVVSYQLASYGIPADVFIDVAFHNDKIQKYRIRSAEIASTDWHQVN